MGRILNIGIGFRVLDNVFCFVIYIYIHIHLYTVDLETQNHPELDRTEMS